MSEDPQESLDLFDDHEEVVSEDGKKVTRKGIYPVSYTHLTLPTNA